LYLHPFIFFILWVILLTKIRFSSTTHKSNENNIFCCNDAGTVLSFYAALTLLALIKQPGR
jgi:hypothetical protein